MHLLKRPSEASRRAQAYVRDAARPEEYETACLDLIAKFKTLRAALRDDGVPDVEHFIATYQMDCASAAARLLRSGLPATIEHGKPRRGARRAAFGHRCARSDCLCRGGTGDAAAQVAEATQHFITSLDVLKLGMHEVDQVQPPLHDLLASLHRVPQLPLHFEGKAKVRDWLARLGGMRAVDKLDDGSVRQLAYDLEGAYNAFIRALGGEQGPSEGRT